MNRTHNPLVQGSNPGGPITQSWGSKVVSKPRRQAEWPNNNCKKLAEVMQGWAGVLIKKTSD